MINGWVIIAGFVIVVFAIMVALGRLPRTTWELVGAALLIGVAGYAWQGHPAQPGEPRMAKADKAAFDEGLAAQRKDMAERFSEAGAWLVLSDGLGRQGNTREAANVLRAGLKQYPKDANLWLGMGNALVSHGGGMLSPAAEYAFQQAMRLDPRAAGPFYFYGLALAQSGELDKARAIWTSLLQRAPADAPYRADLEQNLVLIDSALAGSTGQATP